MRHTVEIALHDLRVFFLDRGNLIGLLVVPVILAVAVGLFSGGTPDPRLRVDVIDLDNSPLSAQFLATLRQANPNLVLCPADNNAEDFCRLGDADSFDLAWATARVQDSTTLAVIAVPAGFEAAVRSFEPVELVYLAKQDFSAAGLIRPAVETAVLRTNGAAVASRVGTGVAMELGLAGVEAADEEALAQALYDRAAALWEANRSGVSFELSTQASVGTPESSEPDGLGQSVPGMGSMFVMFTVLGGMAGLIVERRQWTLQRLASMPISRAQLLGGKILGRFTLGMIQYVVVFTVGVVTGLNFGRDPLAIVLTMVSFTLAMTALSFALGTRLDNEFQAGSLSTLLALTLAPLGGAWWPLEVMPPFMRTLGHISPVAWAMDAYQVLMFQNGDLRAVLLPLSVLLGMTIVFFVIGVRRFRYT